MARATHYFTAAEMISRIPAEDRDIALDDDASGAADSGVQTQVMDDSCNDVDVFYNMRGIATPVDEMVYPLAKQAAVELAIEYLYTRRGEPATRNPRYKMVEMVRELLKKLGEGKLPRGGAVNTVASESPSAVPGEVVAAETEDAFTYPGAGKFLS